MARVEIPFSFSYPSGSVYVAGSSGGSPTTAADILEPVIGTTITVVDRDTGNPATVYAAETGPSTLSSIVTDAGGNVPGWVDPGSYRITAAPEGAFAGAVINFEAVRGDGVTNIAVSAIGTLQLQDGSVTLQKLATAVAKALVPTGAVLDFAGTVAPAGYILSLAQLLDSTDPLYAGLFATIGTRYNQGGEPSGFFRTPDTRNRFALGAGALSHPYAVGDLGGSLNHQHSVPSLSIPPIIVPGLSIPPIVVNAHHHGLSNAGGAKITSSTFNGGSVRKLWVFRHQNYGPTFTSDQRSVMAVTATSQATEDFASQDWPSAALLGRTDDGGTTTQPGTTNGALTADHTYVTGSDTSGAADPAYVVLNRIIKL